MQNAEAKNSVLQRWSEDRVEVFNQACAEWKNFNFLLSRHKDAINKQVVEASLNPPALWLTPLN